jgi:hypothetical protein
MWWTVPGLGLPSVVLDAAAMVLAILLCMRACHSKLLEPRSQHVRTCFTVVTVLLSNLMVALQELLEQFGIVFNSLLCLNNMPIKRWADHLVKE